MPNLTCHEVLPRGSWDEMNAADTVVLDFDGRHRRRLAMTGRAGLSFLLDLPKATPLRDGDGLVLSDGSRVRVTAAPERLVEISAPDFAGLVRIAWHLGNRHLPTQMLDNRLWIRDDHVIAAMVRGLGGRTMRVDAPFDPEGGAYAEGPGHHHHHNHRDDEGDEHLHAHS